MVREYVGARYVPKFMGTYDATQIYEALCVVDNGLGTSYISKIPTPAGTPLTDTDHWAIYGASSGAIINLQNQIDDINNNTIPPIQEDISRLKNRKIVFIGDSYAAKVNSDSKNMFTLIAEKLDLAEYYSFYVVGAAFVDKGQGTYKDILVSNITNITDHDDITDVVVLGGANDILMNQSNIENAIGSFVAYVKTNLPNAIVRIAHVGTNRTSATTIKLYSQYSIPAYKNCGEWGAQYLTASEIILHNPQYLESDNIHPSALGVDAIANHISNCLLGGRSHCWKRSLFTALASSTHFSGISIKNHVIEEVRDDITELKMTANSNMNLTLATPGLTTAFTDKIAEMDAPLIFDGANEIVIPVVGITVESGNVVLLPTCSITIGSDGGLYFSFNPINVTAPTATFINILQLGSASIATQEC